MRGMNASDDELHVLIEKGYVIPFKSGVIVMVDWSINNTLKNDRYKPTLFTREKAQLDTDESGRYYLSEYAD